MSEKQIYAAPSVRWLPFVTPKDLPESLLRAFSDDDFALQQWGNGAVGEDGSQVIIGGGGWGED